MPRETSVCAENIPPEILLESVSEINLVTILFSEYVNLGSEKAISKENIEIEVTGPYDYYNFTWRIIGEDENIYVPNRNITQF